MPTAHVVEGDIDLDRFCEAVAKTLQAFPLYAGRLEIPSNPMGTWKVCIHVDGIDIQTEQLCADQIRLSNLGVPVSFQTSDARTITLIVGFQRITCQISDADNSDRTASYKHH